MGGPRPTLRQSLRSLPPAAWVLFAGTFVNRLGTFVLPFITLYLTSRHFSVPQAGLAVTTAFNSEHPQLVTRLHEHLAEAAAAVVAAPAVAASSAAAALELPWPIIEQSIPWSNLVCRRAAEARPALEAMFSIIAEGDAALLGGRLPPEESYV